MGASAPAEGSAAACSSAWRHEASLRAMRAWRQRRQARTMAAMTRTASEETKAPAATASAKATCVSPEIPVAWPIIA
jgi:hypothetical protein